jgi:hypothetical protein
VHGTDGDLVEDLFGHPVLAHARRASIGRRGELGHRDDLFEVLAAGRGGVGRRRVEQPVPGRVGEESRRTPSMAGPIEAMSRRSPTTTSTPV